MSEEKDVGSVTLKDVRLSFPSLFVKTASVPGGKEKFRANFLIDPKTPQGKANIKAVEAAVAAAEQKVFGRSGVSYKDDRSFWLDGEDCVSGKTGEPYDGYPGMKVVKTTGDKRPQCYNKNDLDTPVTAEDDIFYAGCRVDARVNFYCVKGQDRGGNGLFASLQVIRFRKDDEPFGAAPVDAKDVFDDLDDDDDI